MRMDLVLYHVLASITAQLLAYITRDDTLLVTREDRVFRVVQSPKTALV